MPKSNPCPICDCKAVVVMHHAGKDEAWPECYQCGHRGKEDYKEHMIVHNVNSLYLDKGREEKQELMDIVVDLWNEVIKLQVNGKEVNYSGYDYNKGDEFEVWYDEPMEELLSEDEASDNKE